MNISLLSEKAVLLGSAVAIGAALALARKAVNRRIRLLSLSVVLMVFCEISSSASKLLYWNSAEMARSIAVPQLTASAMALSFVHLLNRENQNRSNADIRLRIFESETNPIGPGKPETTRFKLEAPAMLYTHGLTGSWRGTPITTVDLSDTCLELISPQRYSERAAVRVECYDVQLTGKIRYSLPVVGGFLLGVSLDNKIDPDRLKAMLELHRRHMDELLAVGTA